MVRKPAEKAVYVPGRAVFSLDVVKEDNGKRKTSQFGFKSHKSNALGSCAQGEDPGDNQGTFPTLRWWPSKYVPRRI